MVAPMEAMDDGAMHPVRPPGLRWAGRLAAMALALVALALAGHVLGEHVPELAAWVEARGRWGPLVFAAVYAVWTAVLLPGSALTLVSGALFGPVVGTLVSFAGATGGAALAFLGARHWCRPLVERRLGRGRRFRMLDRVVKRDGLRMMFLLRLSPMIPFNVLNPALGLTGVRFRDYLLASVGMLPQTVLYVWTGLAAGDVATAAAGGARGRGAGHWTVLAVGLVATAAVTLLLARLAHRALRATEGDPA